MDNSPVEEQDWAVPGTRRAAERERADAQQPFTQDFADGLASTAGAGAVRVLEDEAPALVEETWGDETGADFGIASRVGTAVNRTGTAALSLLGFRAGEKDYDKEAKYEELTKGVPYEFHDDIMENDNYEAAGRARARVLADLERGRRMTAQNDGKLAVLAGSLFDVDAPLALFSGGAYGAAKVSRAALSAARLARMSPGAALRLSGTVQGANAGLQAGVLVGAVDAYTRESVGWQDVANMSIQSMLLGSTIGTAVKGDVRVSVQAAQEEFINRVATGDRKFSDPVNVNTLHSDSLSDYMPDQADGPAIIPDGGESGVGAAQATPNMRAGTPSYVTGAQLTPTNQSWITAARTSIQNSGWAQRKAADDDTWWAKVAMSGAMNMTTNNVNRLYKSKAATANYAVSEIFESASGLGRGRATSSVLMENYHKRVAMHLDQELRSSMNEWAKANDMTMGKSGYGISQQGLKVFNREVMLELNDRRMGNTSTRNPAVQRAADQYELAGKEALSIMQGKPGQTAVDGMDNVDPNIRGYTPYRWDGAKIRQLERDGVIDRDDLVQAMAQAYRQSGMNVGKDAEAVAKAVIQRAMAREDGVDMSVVSMLSGDGKDFLRQSLILSGMKDFEADNVINRLTGQQHDRSKAGFAKARNDIDMSMQIPTKDGSTLNVVDLFDQDMHGIWQRYARQTSGAAALARKGITNRAKRKEFTDAIRAEQAAVGEEPMTAELLEAMFSHFDGGVIKGKAAGTVNEGIGHLALMKRAANLALLEKLGVTQIAETGVVIAQQGLKNWLVRGPGAWLNKEVAAGNTKVLDELAFMTGGIGRDQWLFAQHLDLDDAAKGDSAGWLHAVNRMSQTASFVQSYTSAFNHVRGFQQQTAALGVTDRLFREVKMRHDAGYSFLDDAVTARFENDFGMFPEDVQKMFDLVERGVIEFKTVGNRTFVDALNADQWDVEFQDVFGSSITRSMHQSVQKALPGEQDAWMFTHLGSLTTHLKTFPLLAMQKQIMRQAKHLDKEAFTTVLYGLATAAMAVQVRALIDGREMSAGDVAKGAFNYSNLTGVFPMVYDPMMTLIGMDNARLNQFGPTYDWTPPVVNMASQMFRIPGAVKNAATGEKDWYDEQALRAIPFAGTYFLSRLFDS